MIKIALDKAAVATQNSVENTSFTEVIGNKTDTVANTANLTNYRELIANANTITAGTDEAINLISGNLAITEDIKITYTETSDEGADRDIPYSVIYETKE